MGLLDAITAALIRLAGYDRPRGHAALLPSLGDPQVERNREQRGGLSHPASVRSEWYQDDLREAEHLANSGDLSLAGQLWRAIRSDGIVSGTLSTRTDGLVRLPRTIEGQPEIVAALESTTGAVRSVFDEMCPPSELGLLAADGVGLGVGVGEMREVPGRDHPVLIRLDPEWLRYDWPTGTWFYASTAGDLPIRPGDGRWVLHTPGGRVAPWNGGAWRALGRAFIRKTNAASAKDNWEATLANPALVAKAPAAVTDADARSFFRKVARAWGLNTLFGLRPGYELDILEPNGRGYESFQATIESAERECVICIAGQTVLTDGGAGFSNSDVHKSIRADLIQSTADALALTVSSQCLPGWIVRRWGLSALTSPARVTWDVTPPRDLTQAANALTSAASAVKVLREVYGDQLDLAELATRYGIPLRSVVATTTTTEAAA